MIFEHESINASRDAETAAQTRARKSNCFCETASPILDGDAVGLLAARRDLYRVGQKGFFYNPSVGAPTLWSPDSRFT